MSRQPIRLGRGDEYTGFFIDPIEHWSQFFTPCNWYDFTFIKLEVEDDRIMGGVEATVIVLGLGLRVRWNYAKTERVEEIKASVDEIMAQIDRTENTP